MSTALRIRPEIDFSGQNPAPLTRSPWPRRLEAALVVIGLVLAVVLTVVVMGPLSEALRSS